MTFVWTGNGPFPSSLRNPQKPFSSASSTFTTEGQNWGHRTSRKFLEIKTQRPYTSAYMEHFTKGVSRPWGLEEEGV
jgi:hypothetical protein